MPTQNSIKSARADRRHFDATTIGHHCNEACISGQNIICREFDVISATID
jgi:hypothetical protein